MEVVQSISGLKLDEPSKAFGTPLRYSTAFTFTSPRTIPVSLHSTSVTRHWRWSTIPLSSLRYKSLLTTDDTQRCVPYLHALSACLTFLARLPSIAQADPSVPIVYPANTLQTLFRRTSSYPHSNIHLLRYTDPGQMSHVERTMFRPRPKRSVQRAQFGLV